MLDHAQVYHQGDLSELPGFLFTEVKTDRMIGGMVGEEGKTSYDTTE